jgi:hypothetical protein
MQSLKNFPKKFFLYTNESKNLDLEELKNYLHQKIPKASIVIRPEFISYYLSKSSIDTLAYNLAKLRVRAINNPEVKLEPLYGEIQYEKNLLSDEKNLSPGVLYDGYKLHRLFQNLIPVNERNFDYTHIVFTDRLFATYENFDRRYHIRVIICGYPSIISTSGLVEGPAKPKDFYKLKQRYLEIGLETFIDLVKEKFKARFIDYNDKRLTEVAKGYLMQAVFYSLEFEPFCENKNCRLYNAHWQEDLINAQLKGYEFCKKHIEMLEKWQ